ncbi:MAG: hypothetical protein RPU15_09685 [Candidatus Sedimenticola sp. (ex Thyasira tokunagai)]
MNKKILFVVIILLIMFRLFYSLQQNLIDNENEKNLYLVGLKFYTTGEWPYYGEIIESTKSQISGALLGLLVGLPLYILPHPYSPIIFLVLWMTLALSFFAWYISKKKFNIKPIFIWVWTLTIPYTMVYGIKLHIWSYALPYSIFFFITLIELLPLKTKPILSVSWCLTIMGFSLLSLTQLHLSWVLLIPLVIIAFYFVNKKKIKKLKFLFFYWDH